MGQETREGGGICAIVSAFAARSDTSVEQIVDLFGRLRLRAGQADPGPVVGAVRNDAISGEGEETVPCLVCGKGFKMLKRHLRTAHKMSEMDYRVRFGLPEDRPLVAPEYSRRKAEQAREAGLGQRRRASAG
jgi:predicted transcriptional regulator